jgi:hypothetical protein
MMNRIVVAAVSAVFVASAASAASVNTTSTERDQGVQTSSTHASPQIRQEIRDQLAKAGLTDIKVVPEEYVVHAKNKGGNPVVMVVGPNSFLEMTEVKVSNPNDTQAKRSRVEPDPTPLAMQH